MPRKADDGEEGRVTEPVVGPSFRELADLADGRLTPERRAEVLAAVEAAERAGDPAPRRTVEWVHAFRAEAARLPLVTPPPLVRQRLRRLMAATNGTAPALLRVTVELVTDSRRVGRPAGVRGPEQDGDTRYQQTFEAAGVAVVVLDVATAPDRTVTLRGQVLPQITTPAVFEVIAMGPSGVVTSALGDEFGGFTLISVPSDVSTLLLTNDELEIQLSSSVSDVG
jgi:hypothetical protein